MSVSGRRINSCSLPHEPHLTLVRIIPSSFFPSSGAHIVHLLASNVDTSAETARYVLALPGVAELINVPMRASSSKFRILYRVSRLYARFGGKTAMLRTIAAWDGQTALGSACRNSNAAIMEVLLKDGRARTSMKNAQGHTALDQARIVSGADYFHPSLAAVT